MSEATDLLAAAPPRSPSTELFRAIAAFRGVIDTSNDLIFIKDIDSVYWGCNPAFERFTGRSEMTQIGHTDFDFFDQATAAFFRTKDQEMMAGGVPLRNEEWVTYPDGRRVLLDTMKSPIRDPDGQVIGLIGISRDITVEHQRDRSYRLLIETSHDGFWKAGKDGQLLEVNDAYVKMSGYTREELLAMRITDLEAAERPDETARRIRRLIAEGADIFETLHRRKDGSVWQVEVSTSFADLDGGIFYVFLRDIHQRKRDEKLAHMRLQLGELAVNGTIDAILQQALDTAELMTRSNIGFFHFVDPDQETLTLQTWSTNTLKHMCKAEGKGSHYPVSEAGVWADCIRQRKPVLINDYPGLVDKKGMPDGHALVGRVANVPIFDDTGQLTGVLGVGNKPNHYDDDDLIVLSTLGAMAMEMVARRRDADRYKLAASVFESTQDGILITDARLAIIAVNRAFTQVTGYSVGEVFGRDPRSLDGGFGREELYQEIEPAMRSRGYWQGELVGRSKSGNEFVIWLTLNVIRDSDGNVVNYLGVFVDLTEKKAADARADYLSHMDSLTGLPNRVNFEQLLTQTVAHARRRSRSVCLLLLGLDRFKSVNESFGHPVGDEVLKLAAERLQDRLRNDDILARMGGDEFAVLIEEVDSPERMGYLAQQLIEALIQPFAVEGVEVYIGASVGLSLFPLDADDAVHLLRNVDSALALAKSQGRGVYRFYTESLTASARERMELHAQLRHALAANQFEVFYQPQLGLQDNHVTGVEALVRWRRSDGTLVSPASFIPVAEETGLIEDLGAWVLRTSCKDVKAWIDAGVPPLMVAVNVSSRQFNPDKLPRLVSEALVESGLPAALLELEITESAIMGQGEEAVDLLKVLKGLGVALAIDDFGTGYSSLSYLKRFPVDKLKIDQSFVRDIPEDISDMEIATTIIAMARHMRLKVLAEGVETTAQRNFLASQGCDEMQGYLFSRPVPADECLRLIRQTTKK